MGVIVLGMHRSGTSAVTRVIDALGVPVGRTLLPALPENPVGFFEVAPLMELNDQLLDHLGGSWDAPPLPEPGWVDDTAIEPFFEEARELFFAEHPGPQWVWKDPRACVLLPFWRSALGDGHCAVIVLRHPAQITESLVMRNEIPTPLGLAMWERSIRGVLRDAVGMPAMVILYDDLVDRSRATTSALIDFLHAQGALAEADVDRDGEALVDPGLRHHTGAERCSDLSMSAEQLELHEAALRLVGSHDRLPPVDVGSETAWVPAVVSAHRLGNLARAAGGEAPSTVGQSVGQSDQMATQMALDHVLGRLGELERKNAQDSAIVDAVTESLGYTQIGRLERASLRAARGLRTVSRRLGR